MHFHLPKPLHGWRAFAGEVGIIVLGVLIALGAEQLVTIFHERSTSIDARNSVRSSSSGRVNLIVPEALGKKMQEQVMRSLSKIAAATALAATASIAIAVPAEARHYYHHRHYRHHSYGRTYYRPAYYRYRYCRYSPGATGLIAGGVGGALIGSSLIGHGLLGPAVGAVGGAFAGRAIDRSITAPRRCYYR